MDSLLRSGAPYTVGGYSVPAVEVLPQRADTTADPSMRAGLYRQAQRLVLRLDAYIGIELNVRAYRIHLHVHGLVAGLQGAWPADGDWLRVGISR